MLYQKFRNSSLDTSPLGLYSGSVSSNSVFTPSGARIIAWSGHDGIHFCQVKDFGEMVFAVDPGAPPGDCIHPVALDLLDFLGLVYACKDALIIARAYQWSSCRFMELVNGIRPGMKTKSVLRALQNTYHPPVIEDPYRYIAEIQKDFDYGRIPLHQDYFEWCPIRPGTPKWDVGFGTGFAEYCEKGKAGQELAVGRTFQWHGESWCVPAVYLCENGIVVDSYLEVPQSQMRTFMEKWGSTQTEHMSIEGQMQFRLENPLSVETKSTLLVNGKLTPPRKSFLRSWNPITDNTWNARRVLEHYGLDREKGYLLRRECFLRKGKNPPIRTMELTLIADPVSVPGQRFVAPKAGESMTFTHPATEDEHELTVLSLTREALDPNFLSNHPCCYTRLIFSLEPPISKEWFSVVDCDPGDSWQGRRDGPSTAALTDKIPDNGHCAVSSLRYTPAEQITWRMIFRQKLREDILIRLLP